MNTSETIFFDLDGTLLDISERYYRLFTDFCAKHGHSLTLTKEEYWRQKRERLPETRYLTDAGLLIAAEQWPAFQQSAIEAPEYLRYDTPWPGVPALLERLSQKYPLMLVTFRRKREHLLEQLDGLQLTRFFAEILSPLGNDAAIKNPSPELKTQLVRDRFPATPFRGWFVGDTETDIHCGRALGCRSIAVTYGIHSRRFLEVGKPDEIFELPKQLVEWAPTIT